MRLLLKNPPGFLPRSTTSDGLGRDEGLPFTISAYKGTNDFGSWKQRRETSQSRFKETGTEEDHADLPYFR